MAVKITDSVADVLFRNDENGYTVMRLASGETAFGFFPYIAPGQEFDLMGEYVQSAKYGKQFKVSSHEARVPSTPEKIEHFIGSGLLPGIGPKTAEKIVERFGSDTLAIMEHRCEELVAIKGVTLLKAEAIGREFANIKDMQKSVGFLQQFEISLNMAIKIYNTFKENTISAVRQNPYRLIEKIDGIGFITADKIAKELGVAYAGKFRVRAGLVHVIKSSAEAEGHTCMPVDKLFAGTIRLLLIKTEQLRDVFDGVIEELCIDGYISRIDDMICLSKYFYAEKSIAEKLLFLAAKKVASETKDVEKLLIHYEKVNKIELHADQRRAVIEAVSNGVTVITGGPGTGKTTIIRAVLFINEARGQKTQLLAPTGRAAKRLEETTGLNASTIHRALDIDYKGGKGHFTYDDPENVLRADVVIVDEVSMCDAILMNQLLKKVLSNTRVVLVGDIDQLASVGPGNVLEDIITAEVVPLVRLTEIYRTTADSKIVVSAHAINNGEMPDMTNKSKDFFYVQSDSPYDIREKVVSLVTKRLPEYLKIPHTKIQVLCPMKAGDAGMTAVNLALQQSINPKEDGKPEYQYGETVYRLGDRVMQTANNYTQEWTKPNDPIVTSGEGVFNGDMGVITDVNKQNGEVRVLFEDGRQSVYLRGDLSSLVTSYAITVHKSQGCEFDVVVVPVTSGAYMVLTRNLLYTAVTRAKVMVVLVGSHENIEKMVKNTYTKHRWTMLSYFLKNSEDKVAVLTSV
ncbi:MAG: ATP-dependent RecD-like DNA helicase [Firmicutes bacterium]|nr:ATP-dependent RecD-like DNA helicase [Bacillota bacterium]